MICYDYDLCAGCYEDGATSTSHQAEHPMQCILARTDFEIFYGGEPSNGEQPQSFTCPYCKKMGFSDTSLYDHVNTEHTDTGLEVVCPVCAALPGGDPNLVTDDFAGHLTLEHRTGPRDLISFLISFLKLKKIPCPISDWEYLQSFSIQAISYFKTFSLTVYIR